MDNDWDILNGQVYGKMISQIEKEVIIKVLEYCEGNQIETAKMLGVHRNTLYNKIKKLRIDIRKFKR